MFDKRFFPRILALKFHSARGGKYNTNICIQVNLVISSQLPNTPLTSCQTNKQATCSSIQEYIDLATIVVHVRVKHRKVVGVIVVVNVVAESCCLQWLLRVRLACMSVECMGAAE